MSRQALLPHLESISARDILDDGARQATLEIVVAALVIKDPDTNENEAVQTRVKNLFLDMAALVLEDIDTFFARVEAFDVLFGKLCCFTGCDNVRFVAGRAARSARCVVMEAKMAHTAGSFIYLTLPTI